MTFIDNVSDKTNIDIVVSETKGGHEARDDPKAGLESVQKIDHVGAGSVGNGDKPPRICPAWHGDHDRTLFQETSYKNITIKYHNNIIYIIINNTWYPLNIKTNYVAKAFQYE